MCIQTVVFIIKASRHIIKKVQFLVCCFNWCSPLKGCTSPVCCCCSGSFSVFVVVGTNAARHYSTTQDLVNITKRKKKMNISFTEPDGLNITSMNRDDSVICLSSWIDSWSVYISDITVVAVNYLFSIFATLINLAVIVTVKRTPVLHRPFNALICSLAAADFLSGLVAQPVYASWRLLLHTTKDPCGLEHLFQVTKSLNFLFVGCTFLNLAITSVERLFAVSKPIAYSTTITLRGM